MPMDREQIEAIVTAAAQTAGLPPALSLAQCEEESGFDPEAESPEGAVGLFQLEPATRKVTFDNEKCVACGLCIKSCPPRAMELHF